MNPFQLSQQLKFLLQTVTWADGSEEVVFGQHGVAVFAGAVQEDNMPPGFPFALITIDNGTPDPDEPSLIKQGFSIAVAVEVAGDPLGEHAVIGSSRADIGKSAGAGLAEVAERVRFATQKLAVIDGASVVVSASGVSAPQPLGRGRHMVMESYALEAWCTSQPVFIAPQQVQRSGGTLRWSGKSCSERFDFLQYRVAWKLGPNPPATPADGTIVYTGTATECAVTFAGNRTYAVFADYDPRGTGSPAASSSAVVGSYVRTWTVPTTS